MSDCTIPACQVPVVDSLPTASLELCTQAVINWHNGAEPYSLNIMYWIQPYDSLIPQGHENITGIDTTSYTWTVDAPVGMYVTFTVADNVWRTGESPSLVLIQQGDNSCLFQTPPQNTPSSPGSSPTTGLPVSTPSSSPPTETAGPLTSSVPPTSSTSSTTSSLFDSLSSSPTNSSSQIPLASVSNPNISSASPITSGAEDHVSSRHPAKRTGLIAGVAVAGTLVLLFFVFACWFYRRRRAQARRGSFHGESFCNTLLKWG